LTFFLNILFMYNA